MGWRPNNINDGRRRFGICTSLTVLLATAIAPGCDLQGTDDAPPPTPAHQPHDAGQHKTSSSDAWSQLVDTMRQADCCSFIADRPLPQRCLASFKTAQQLSEANATRIALLRGCAAHQTWLHLGDDGVLHPVAAAQRALRLDDVAQLRAAWPPVRYVLQGAPDVGVALVVDALTTSSWEKAVELLVGTAQTAEASVDPASKWDTQFLSALQVPSARPVLRRWRRRAERAVCPAPEVCAEAVALAILLRAAPQPDVRRVRRLLDRTLLGSPTLDEALLKRTMSHHLRAALRRAEQSQTAATAPTDPDPDAWVVPIDDPNCRAKDGHDDDAPAVASVEGGVCVRLPKGACVDAVRHVLGKPSHLHVVVGGNGSGKRKCRWGPSSTAVVWRTAPTTRVVVRRHRRKEADLVVELKPLARKTLPHRRRARRRRHDPWVCEELQARKRKQRVSRRQVPRVANARPPGLTQLHPLQQGLAFVVDVDGPNCMQPKLRSAMDVDARQVRMWVDWTEPIRFDHRHCVAARRQQLPWPAMRPHRISGAFDGMDAGRWSVKLIDGDVTLAHTQVDIIEAAGGSAWSTWEQTSKTKTRLHAIDAESDPRRVDVTAVFRLPTASLEPDGRMWLQTSEQDGVLVLNVDDDAAHAAQQNRTAWACAAHDERTRPRWVTTSTTVTTSGAPLQRVQLRSDGEVLAESTFTTRKRYGASLWSDPKRLLTTSLDASCAKGAVLRRGHTQGWSTSARGDVRRRRSALCVNAAFSTPTPCHKPAMRAALDASDPFHIVVDVTAERPSGVCVDTLGSVRLDGRVDGIAPGRYRVSLIRGGLPFLEKTITVRD